MGISTINGQFYKQTVGLPQSLLCAQGQEDQRASVQGVEAPASVAIDEEKGLRIGTEVLQE